MRSKKNRKSIRSKIVVGYIRIYIIISFILLLALVSTLYFVGFVGTQSYAKDDIQEIIHNLPKYNETIDVEDIYNKTAKLMPDYIIRYDLFYESVNIKEEDLYDNTIYINIKNDYIDLQLPVDINIKTEPSITPKPITTVDTEKKVLKDFENVQPILGYVTANELNVRSGPSMAYEIIDIVKYGEEIKILEQGSWHAILHKDELAYVGSEYTIIGSNKPEPTPNPNDDFWRIHSEHLFSKSGTSTYTTTSFDERQRDSSFYNLKEIDRLYASSSTTWYVEHESQGYIQQSSYQVRAVVDITKIIEESVIWSILLIVLIAFSLFFIAGFILVAVYGAYKTRKYLKPISDITKLASEIQPNSMYRINVNTARFELQELVITINDMLDRLQAAHVKRRKFVSDVSHELRTPISVITGYANMLKRWAKDDQAVFDESVEAIIEESENMKYLVENLLFLARCDNDQLMYDMEVFDVSNLIEGIYKDANLIDNKKHDITGDIAQGVIINGDRNRLKQAFREFVQNAIKYTPPTESINISLQKLGEKAIINITDKGIGISKKDMGNIFSRFYRGDVSRNRDNGGYGLGLSIAREIVSAHNGKITIRSKEGVGTSVVLSFDLA
ncbi:MAG: ATP-binding protein [Clostridiales bacterium]|nr:ATP-binding protein [Clostridiales bacterium]